MIDRLGFKKSKRPLVLSTMRHLLIVLVFDFSCDILEWAHAWRDQKYGKQTAVTELFNSGVNDFRAKKSARCRQVFVVTELFNIAVNDFDAKKSVRCGCIVRCNRTRCKWVLIGIGLFVVAELLNIAVNDIDAKKSAHCWRMHIVTELF